MLHQFALEGAFTSHMTYISSKTSPRYGEAKANPKQPQELEFTNDPLTDPPAWLC